MKFVFCIATSLTQANHIVDHLKIAGFYPESISFLLADNSANIAFVCAGDIRQHREEVGHTRADNAVRARLGGACVVIQGAGPFHIAGPITGVMKEAPVGVILGGVCGGLIRMGLPQFTAKRYEGKLLYGDILLSVPATTSAQRKQATGIFHRAKATDICIAERSNTASVERQPITLKQAI